MSRSTLLVAVVAVLAVVAVSILAWIGGNGSGESTPVAVSSTAAAGEEPARAGGESAGLPAAGGAEPAPGRREAAAASAGDLAFEVLLAGGMPAAGARVIVFRAAEVLSAATTDESGRATVRAAPLEAELAIFTPDAPLLRRPLDPGATAERIVLAPGAEVSGWIVIDGGPPGEEVALSLLPATVWSEDEVLPDPVWEALGTTPAAPREIRTAADGAFRFGGLPEEWRGGRIPAPAGLHPLVAAWDAPTSTWPFPGKTTPVAGPAVGLVLEYARAVVLRGRVVHGESGGPVPRARVRLEARMPEHGNRTSTNREADQEGRFAVLLQPPVFAERLSLTLASTTGAGEAMVALSPTMPDAAGVWDLGDLPLETFSELRFLVQNSAARPVEGALVSTPPEGYRTTIASSAPTDSTGRTSFEVDPHDEKLIVVAQGYDPAEIRLESTMPDPIVVTLAGGTELAIAVTRGGGPPPAGLLIHIASQEPLFPASNSWLPDPANRIAGAKGAMGESRGPPEGRAELQPDECGRLELSGICAGVPLTIRVFDPCGLLAREIAVAPLRKSERRELAIELPPGLRSLRGVVRGPDGAPVGSAQVALSIPAERRASTQRCEPDGSFTFEGYLPDRVALQVTAPGFAPLLEADYPLPPEGVEVVLRLTAGWPLRVIVVDPDGRPIEGGSVHLEADGSPLRSPVRSGGPGVFEVADLPFGDVTVRLELAGRTFERILDASLPEARFVVPRPSPVELRIEGPPSADGDTIVFIRAREDPTIRFLRGLDLDAGPPWTLRLPALLPGSYVVRVNGRRSESGPVVDLSAPVPLTVPPGGGEVRATIRY
ncbi:MAG: carboxypeptidase regulatory-like domain-containing protein [Planctomycetota bacterium]